MIEIPLTKGYVAIIDDEDAHLATRKWYASANKNGVVYARHQIRVRPGYGGQGSVLLHRVIVGAPKGVLVDHANGNTLDCRRANLRLADRRLNSANSRRPAHGRHGFKGVGFDPRLTGRPWQARLCSGGTTRSLGYYCTAEEAARAYDRAARAEFGAFACVNFADPGERCALARAFERPAPMQARA